MHCQDFQVAKLFEFCDMSKFWYETLCYAPCNTNVLKFDPNLLENLKRFTAISEFVSVTCLSNTEGQRFFSFCTAVPSVWNLIHLVGEEDIWPLYCTLRKEGKRDQHIFEKLQVSLKPMVRWTWRPKTAKWNPIQECSRQTARTPKSTTRLKPPIAKPSTQLLPTWIQRCWCSMHTSCRTWCSLYQMTLTIGLLDCFKTAPKRLCYDNHRTIGQFAFEVTFDNFYVFYWFLITYYLISLPLVMPSI